MIHLPEICGKEERNDIVEGTREITLRQTDCENPDFLQLCKELDAFLNEAVGGEEKREKYKKFNHANTMDVTVIAYDGKEAVGCGALRKYSKDEIEVKRVFVKEAYRGQNIGGMIMEELILQARKLSFQRMILETGVFLMASVRLYERYGFERIENYGAYRDMPESLCMGRAIDINSICYCIGKQMETEELRELFDSVEWLSARYADRLVKAFRSAGTVISAWHQDKLIGLIEVLDDGELTAYVHYLLVRPQYQHRGIAAHMLEAVKRIYQDYLYLILLSEKADTIPFYEKRGFTVIEGSTPMQIRNL